MKYPLLNEISKCFNDLIPILIGKYIDEWEWIDIDNYGYLVKEEIIKNYPKFNGEIKMSRHSCGFNFKIMELCKGIIEGKIQIGPSGYGIFTLKLVEAA